MRNDGAFVPALWHLELGNVLLQAEKRGRIRAADVATRLQLIADLPISVDQETTVRAWREILTLARAERLTLRRDVPLMTRDNELSAAARRLRVTVLP